MMTEAEWSACTDPRPMLEFLSSRNVTDRKLRLFGCACCRQLWDWLGDPASGSAVATAERYADGLATDRELKQAQRKASRAVGLAHGALYELRPDDPKVAEARARHGAATAALALTYRSHPSEWLFLVVDAARELSGTFAGLLRDLVGSPFRPRTADTSWRAWQAGLLERLARAIYDERHLPEGRLDGARLAILADALEEAGCTDTELLGHVRSAGPHVRACFAMDLLLGWE